MTVTGKADGTVSGETRTDGAASVSFTTMAPPAEKAPAAAASEEKAPPAPAATPRARRAAPAAAATPTEELTPASGDTSDDTDAGDDDQDELNADGTPKTPAADPDAPKAPVRSKEDQELFDAAFAEGARSKETEQERTAREAAEALETEAQATALREHETTTIAELHALKLMLPNDEGVLTAYKLPKSLMDEMERVVKDKNGTLFRAHAAQLQDKIETAVLKLVPEDKRAETTKALQAASSPDELVQLIVDSAATAARPLKDAALETVLGLSPKAKREHLEAIRAAKNEAKEAERTRIFELHGIEGEPEVKGGAVRDRWKNLDELNKARVAGLLPDDAQFLREQNKFLGIGG